MVAGQVGTVYRAGEAPVRVVYRDGSVSHHPPHSFFVFGKTPLKVEGRVYVWRQGRPAFEVKRP